MIRAVFFDYDGVLTTDKTGSLTTTRYLSEATGISLPRVKAAFSRRNNELTLGRATHAQIWQEVCAELGEAISISLLHAAFESTPLNTGMLSLARDLKRSHSVGIITDNKKDRIDYLKRHQSLGALFNPIVVSAELGADKGSAGIFLHALQCVGVQPSEAVFIDNNLDNLAAPTALGINTVFHDDERNDIEALVSKLKSFGVCAGNA